LGCANIARRSVIPAVKALPDKFELVAVASRSHDKAGEFARQFACEGIAGYDPLIHSPALEALYIPLPTGLHREWVNKALLAGKHVYAEKSIAMNPTDAREMVDHARQSNVALMEGLMFQYHGQHKIVLDLIRNGEIGGLRFFSSSFGFPPLAPDNFRYDEALGGGVLMDAAAYPVRATHFILGGEFIVQGATLFHVPRSRAAMYGSAFLTDSTGMGAAVSFGFDNFYQCRYEIWGERGKITAERAFTPTADQRPRIVLEKPGRSDVILAEPDNHFVRALEEFHGLVTGTADRGRHYRDILLQSHSLERIKLLGGDHDE
jgi:predicted dehydrogenase